MPKLRSVLLLPFPLGASVVTTLLVASTPAVTCAQEAASLTSTSSTSDAPKVDQKIYDPKAEAVLQRAADRVKAAQSLSGQVVTLYKYPARGKTPASRERIVKTFRIQRPGFVYNDVSTQQIHHGRWIVMSINKYVSNGKKGVCLETPAKTYRSLPVTKEALGRSYQLEFSSFFNPALSDVQAVRAAKSNGRLVSLTLAPDAVYAGVPCFVVEQKNLVSQVRDKDTRSSALFFTTKTYIGKKDGIMRGWRGEWPSLSNDGAVTMAVTESTVTNVVVSKISSAGNAGNISKAGNVSKTGTQIPTSAFKIDVAGYKESVPPVRPPLLAAGTLAPDFTVSDKEGKPVALSDFRGKIVVLDFWATWCGPCMESMPHTAEVARKTADKGVVVLAVNVSDKKENFDKWVPAHPEFSALTFAIDTRPWGQDVASKLYKVWGIPTQYVIDRDGKIVSSFVVGGAEDLEKAIAKADAGIKK